MTSKKKTMVNNHLKDCEEGYFEHLLFSLTISVWLIIAALTLAIHAIFPFIFIEKTTRHVKKINQVMQIRISKAKKRTKKKGSN